MKTLLVMPVFFGSLLKFSVNNISKYVATHSWMYSTIEYNYENDIKITIPHGQLKGKRKNSKAIMQCALEIHDNRSTLKAINSVRMQHDVVTFADICSANGGGLDK